MIDPAYSRRLLQSQRCCFIREIQFRLSLHSELSTLSSVYLPCETAVLALLSDMCEPV